MVMVVTTKTLDGGKETCMFTASLPFDYLKHLDRYDPARRMLHRPIGSRVRRHVPSEGLGE